MSKIEVDKVDPQSGTALEIGTSGDTVTVPSGVGLTLTDSTLLLPTTITSTTEVKTNKISPATGVAFTLGDSGDTFTVPSGATIANLGTATGFGAGNNAPAFSAQMSGTQTISHNTTTKVEFDTEIFDTDGEYDPDTNYRFTPQTAGEYVVNANLYCDGQGQGNWRIYGIYIYKNAALFAQYSFDMATGYTNNGTKGVTAVVTMNGSDDYLEVFTYQFTQDSSTSPVGGTTTALALFSAYKLNGV